MLEKRAQNTLELLPSGIRTSTLLCIYRSQVCHVESEKMPRLGAEHCCADAPPPSGANVTFAVLA